MNAFQMDQKQSAIETAKKQKNLQESIVDITKLCSTLKNDVHEKADRMQKFHSDLSQGFYSLITLSATYC
jgi:uncharacterized coiled-coil DUF342 family protein